jgi:hypothetical protein
VIITTDGLENSSKEFTLKQIKEMITHQTEVYKWEFIFLAANQDAILTGQAMGISKNSSLTYANSAAGTTEAYRSLSRGISIQRMAPETNFAFTAEDREQQEKLLES